MRFSPALLLAFALAATPSAAGGGVSVSLIIDDFDYRLVDGESATRLPSAVAVLPQTPHAQAMTQTLEAKPWHASLSH